MKTCCISQVQYNETDVKPVMVHFENGQLNKDQEDRLLCRILRDKADKLHATATTDHLVYSGTVNQDQLYNYFIGVRNKKTNKMRLIAIDNAVLAPVFSQEEKLAVSSEATNVSTRELNKQFGSKRIKRQTEQHERMQLDVENVREHLEETVADVKIDFEETLPPSVNQADADYKPPINRQATEISQVYQIDKLISFGVLKSLSSEVERILETNDDLGTVTFITQQLKELMKTYSGDDDEKELRCKLFLYIDCLIKFMISPMKVITTKKYVACSYSRLVNEDILNKFTIPSPKGRLRPNIMKDKCLCYILVLSMIACKYNLDLGSVSKELKIGIRKLQDVCRVLLFNVNSERAKLSLPLPAPVVTNKRNKKGR